MQALVLSELKQPLTLETRPTPEPEPGEVVVKLQAAAINRRDYWITQGMYPGIKLPCVLGSDGAGVVEQVGEEVAQEWRGREIVINPGWAWGERQAAQGSQFQILGMPADGTYASHVKVPACYLMPKPAHLSWSEAAALPLAGVTAYRAMFSQGRWQSGEKILINGIGGGVATCALQYAIACGATVLVTSSASAKIDQALALGATAGYLYTAENWHKQLLAEHGAIDLIVDSAGGEGYANLVEIAAPGGRIVNYGATAGPPKKLDLFKVFWKQLHLIGSTMGSPDDFSAMLDLVNRQRVKPIVDEVFALEQGDAALQRMADGQQFGKLVLNVV